MPGYPFDQNLIPSVLADPIFRSSGIYTGDDRGLYYCVMDPRVRTVNVWRKARGRLFGYLDYLLPPTSLYLRNFVYYQLSALRGNHAFFTNGPMMTAPPSTVLPFWARAAKSLFNIEIRWVPLNAVVSGAKIIDGGIRSNGGGGYFARIGRGRFSDYAIGPMPMPAPGVRGAGVREGIAALTLIVSNGGLVTNVHTQHVHDRTGVAVWAKVPFAVPVRTDDWESELPYLDPSPPDETPQDRHRLDGVILAAASDQPIWNMTIASDLLGVGASDAVATDPSDSVICGSRSSLHVRCDQIKDAIQEYGLCID